MVQMYGVNQYCASHSTRNYNFFNNSKSLSWVLYNDVNERAPFDAP